MACGRTRVVTRLCYDSLFPTFCVRLLSKTKTNKNEKKQQKRTKTNKNTRKLSKTNKNKQKQTKTVKKQTKTMKNTQKETKTAKDKQKQTRACRFYAFLLVFVRFCIVCQRASSSLIVFIRFRLFVFVFVRL
jgi:Flp pilus assembly protein TadB